MNLTHRAASPRRAQWRVAGKILLLCCCGCGVDNGRIVVRNNSDLLTCRKPTVDVGQTSETKSSGTFEILNFSPKSVTLTKFGQSCSCTQILADKKVIPPGETATITVQAETNPRHPGQVIPFSHEVLLHANDRTVPELTLHLRGEFVPSFFVRRDKVSVEARAGEPFGASFSVFSLKRAAQPTPNVTVQINAGVFAEVKRLESSADARFEQAVVHVHGTLPADCRFPHSETVRIGLDTAKVEAIACQVLFQDVARSTVEAWPETLAFGVVSRKTGKPILKRVMLKDASGQPLQVRTVSSSNRGITFHPSPSPSGNRSANTTTVEIHLDPRQLAPGPLDGQVRIHLESSRGEEIKEIALSGVVKDERRAGPESR